MSNIEKLIKELCSDGVEYKELKSVFEMRNGYTPSKAKAEFWEGGTIPWFRMEDIRENGITEQEVKKSFSQLKGSLFMGLETVNSRMNKLGRSLLSYDRVITPEENVQKLAKVTVADVQALAKELFQPEKLQITILGAVKDVQMPSEA